MTTRITFPNVEFFAAPSGQAVRVLLGETFTLQLDGEAQGSPIKWATVNDAALEVTETAVDAVSVKASAVGPAEIQVQVNRQVQYHITVDVYSNEAASLNLVAGEPALK